MAPLFSKGTIQEEVASMQGLEIDDKIAIVKKLYADHKKGLTADEGRYEQTFNQLFFNELLGYERNTNLYPKAGTPVGSKIADAALGAFLGGKYNFDDVQVVVELKGAKVFLDKKQNRQNPQSPVDQGFGYKTSFKNCKWLLVSNFHQIRLYRDNKQDYEERNLEELHKGENNRFVLRRLLALLSKNRLLRTDASESRAEKLLSDFRYEQQQISKEFYVEYKQLRLELINDIRQRNKNISITTVVEKAQKIIDRLIFIHFCEDKGLLPADKLKVNVKHAREADFTPWEVIRKFFAKIDTGSEKLGIPDGYNGELFKPDAIIDGLQISDSICMKFVDLGEYDFDDTISVNILGHIFEQSISDLENLKIELLGTELTTEELVENKKKSKRKKDGIFYTPEYIVDYIVQNSLMKYLQEHEEVCLKKYKNEQKAYQAYQQILQNIKVLDPACGSGAFLVRVFDVLLEENKRVGAIIAGLFDETETYKNILTNNIYGVDLNPESVEITKLSLWLKSAQKGKKLNNLDKNIKCGNSLINDPAVAGEKAFDWKKEFKVIMDAGGFDVIVGNPPYGATIDQKIDGINETYLLFYKLGADLLKRGGVLSFITPDSWLTNHNGAFVRELFIKNGTILSIYDVYKVFDDAPDVRCNVVVFEKGGKTNKVNIAREYPYNLDMFNFQLSRDRILRYGTGPWFVYINDDLENIFSRMQKYSSLSDFFDIKRGFSPTPNAKNITRQETSRKIIGGEDFGRYEYKIKDKYLIDEYDKSRNQISKIMEKCFVGIQRIRTNSLDFRSRRLICQYFSKGVIPIDSIGYCISNSDLNEKYLLTLLNSNLLNIYYKLHYTDKNVKPLYLKKLPIKRISVKEQQPFIEKADQMIDLNKDFHEKKSSALHLLQAEYGIEKISRKLESFYELDFADFLKAMKLKNISLDKKEELMGRFGKKKEELMSLKNMIDQTDREIDEMVFDLYGLSDEERKVVLGG